MKIFIGAKPKTYGELVAKLEYVDMLEKTASRHSNKWAVTDDAFRLIKGVPPGKGYSVDLTAISTDQYQLMVKCGSRILLNKVGKKTANFEQYLIHAERHAKDSIDRHLQDVSMGRDANIASRGTASKLTERQMRVMKANGHSWEQVDRMPYARAKAMINNYMKRWKNSAVV